MILSFRAYNGESFDKSERWEKVVEIKTIWDEVFIIVADTIIDNPWENDVRISINHAYYTIVKDQLLLDLDQSLPDFVKHPSIVIEKQGFKTVRLQLMALRSSLLHSCLDVTGMIRNHKYSGTISLLIPY